MLSVKDNIGSKKIIISIVVLCLIVGLLSWVYIGKSRGIPFVKRMQWSIGIYTGDSPLNLIGAKNIKNPVLTAKDVKDTQAEFVADPFMVYENNKWYMFFEILNKKTDQGDISVATSKEGLHWNYEQIVLDEPFHLSYPYVFKWNDEYYMIPESYETQSIRLYKAEEFPAKWAFVRTLVEGKDFVDNSLLYYINTWWLFSSTTSNDMLYLYYSDDILGEWKEHPSSPVVDGDANIARLGGRIIIYNDKIIRFAQDAYPNYGNQIRAFEITKLTKDSYKEEEVIESPILEPTGKGWNMYKMHQVDPHHVKDGNWIACVDGWSDDLIFGLNI
ncbi:MAG: hypothetical protein KAK00_08715 [Nanoarchaeota archaeon]|nr:hypothetical protein [Nanoarchaeota archaeon]